jgi:predicted metalloprotease with PDZ domain
MNGLGLAGAELHGIIGYTVLARFRLGFDFTKDKMSWTPLAFEPAIPEGLNGKAVPGMDALGSIMKLVGAMLGKKPEPEIMLRGFLGVGLEESANTVQIKQVLAGGPAADAGLRAGDCIRQFQGKPVQSLADIQRLAAKLAAEDTATVTITRGGKTQTLRIKAGKGL